MSDIELQKRQIDIQLDEYQQAIDAAVKWHENWKSRQRGFRVNRSQSEPNRVSADHGRANS